MPTQPKVSDFQNSWIGGVDAGRHPALIGLDQAASAVNLSFRGGKPHPRNPWLGCTLNFIAREDIDSESWFKSQIYQGGVYYSIPRQQCFVMSIGGRIFIVTPRRRTFDVQDVTPDEGNLQTGKMAWLVQVDKYVVIQDGRKIPYYVSGYACDRVRGSHPVPIGTAMAYGNGRLIVAQGQNFVVGDLIGSYDGSVLQFSETTYLNEGGNFKLPANMGNVVGFKFIAQQDTATGQGGLLAFGEYGVASVNLLVPRDQWKSVQIQAVTLLNIGGTGHRSICNVNGDVWFHSQDGWRSYRQARAEINGWNQVPQSSPVRQYVDRDTPQFLRYVSAVFWDNRLLVTSGPTVRNGFSYHFGLLSLDFDPISNGLVADARPAWDGFWTMPTAVFPTELLTGIFDGELRCFAMTGGQNPNAIYELGKDGTRDDGEDGQIQSQLVSRKFTFPSAPPYIEKSLIGGGDLRLSDARGEFNAVVEFQQDDSCQWKPWQLFSAQGQSPSCSTTGEDCDLTCQTCYYAPKMLFVNPPTGVSSGRIPRQKENSSFIDLQLRLTWQAGYFQLESIRPAAQLRENDMNGEPVTVS